MNQHFEVTTFTKKIAVLNGRRKNREDNPIKNWQLISKLLKALHSVDYTRIARVLSR